MVLHSNHDFTQYSWSTAVIGIIKLAIILVVATYLFIFILMMLFGDMPTGDELHQEELQRWCKTGFPNLTFDECVEQEGL